MSCQRHRVPSYDTTRGMARARSTQTLFQFTSLYWTIPRLAEFGHCTYTADELDERLVVTTCEVLHSSQHPAH